MAFLLFNGQFLPAGSPVLDAGNRSYRYGDGLFETIKCRQQQLPLAALHHERLLKGLDELAIRPVPGLEAEALSSQLIELCRRNGCAELGRVRLSVYRQDDEGAGYLAEAGPLAPDYHQWNERGWELGLHPHIRKAQDRLSNLKSASFLPYVLADRQARAAGWDDCLLLNSTGGICDTSRANIFLRHEDRWLTPALDQGCVAGVMRRHLIDTMRKLGEKIEEAAIQPQLLNEAEEVFLTNALVGLRWVARYGERTYTHQRTVALYQQVMSTI